MITKTVVLDRDRELRMGTDAIERILSIPLPRRDGRNPLQLWGDTNGMDYGAAAILVWAANRHEDKSPEWTVEQARKVIKRALTMRRITFKDFNDAINELMREAFGIAAPTDTPDGLGDEEDETVPMPPASTDGGAATVAAGLRAITLPSGSAD